MFAATFLGHQGWLFSTSSTQLLVDPLLVEPFGHGGVVGRVYPPRRVRPKAFPRIDAVLYTHEHEDHFNLPSLNRLDRRIPIYLSALSSTAARTILSEMGFEVRLVRGGDRVSVGDLDVFTFCANHVGTDGDEWDLLQFLIRDRRGHGSFFSAVDAPATRETLLALRTLVERPGLWCYTNNSTEWSCLEAGVVRRGTPPFDTGQSTSSIASRHSELCFEWQRPAATLFCGGGFSFDQDRAWLNREVFHADSNQIAAALRLLTDEPVIAPTPGLTVRMRRGKVVSTDSRAAFITTPPRKQWPSRDYAPSVDLIENYQPACGRLALANGDLAELTNHLRDFARYLYGGRLFTGLYSAPGRIAGHKNAFALVLLAGDNRPPHVFEYQPQEGAFLAVRCDDPSKQYVAGIECWATDLLAAFRAEFGPAAIAFGRGRGWSFAPEQVPGDLGLLWSYFNPLRRTESYLALYRRLLALEPRRVPQVPARRHRSGSGRDVARTPKSEQHVFLSPHFDDAVLSCGGRLAANARRGVPQQIVNIFAGVPPDASPDVARYVQVRRAEDCAALTYLGLADHIINFQLVDGIFRSRPNGRRHYDPHKMCGPVNPLDLPLIDEIAVQLMARFPDPRHVTLFAPLGIGNHVDHVLTHRAARELSKRGYAVAFYEDLPYALGKSGASRRPLNGRGEWTSEEFLLKEEHLSRKVAALRYYQSQIPALFGDADQMNESLRAFAAAARGNRRRFVERMWHLR